MNKTQTTTLHTILAQLMKDAKVNLVQLSRNTGLAVATLHRLLHEPDISPRISTLKPIAQFFKLTVPQLLGDEPLPLRNEKGQFIENRKYWLSIPIINWEEAKNWQQFVKTPSHRAVIQTDIDISPKAFALKLDHDIGDVFKQGAVIILEPGIKALHQHYVLVYRHPSPSASLKQVIEEDGYRFLVSLDARFQTVPFSKEYQLLGVVRQIRYDFSG